MAMNATPTKKAAGGFNTTTATTTHNATDFIATCARQASAKGYFCLKAGTGIGKAGKGAAKGCDTIYPGAENTTKQAGNLPDSEVFSRPEHFGFGRECANRKAARTTCFVFSTPVHLLRLKSAASGFSVQQGTKTMTITTPKTGNPSHLARQQAIENALSTALYFIRLPNTESGLKAATGRAIRAASMLKQACAEIQNGRAQ